MFYPTDIDAKVVLFADNTTITVTICNQEGVQTVQPKPSLVYSYGLKPKSHR
jgi:hypothetical protein